MNNLILLLKKDAIWLYHNMAHRCESREESDRINKIADRITELIERIEKNEE